MYRDVPLHKLTTLKVGGKAELFAVPDNTDKLIKLLHDCVRLGIPYKILGRGSNLLIAGEKIDGIVIHNNKSSTGLDIRGKYIKAGSSVSLQRLLTQAANSGLGGCEYLQSVPGNIGGAVYMNAGRGRNVNRQLSDHVVRVHFFDGKKTRTYTHRQCRFGYRESIFHSIPQAVILSAELKLSNIGIDIARQSLKERIRFMKERQDYKLPNAGTVYKSNFKLGQELMGLACGTTEFSKITTNWILNKGDKSPNDVLALLRIAENLHINNNLKKPELEWTVWW